MEKIRMKRGLYFVTVVFLASISGCGDVLEVQNLPGHVTFVGPQEVTASGRDVVTWFGVSDQEGDLLGVELSLCLMSGECQGLSASDLLPGSVDLERVPSQSDGVSTALKVVWSPPCAFLGDDDAFTVSLGVIGSDVAPLVSSPSSLNALGVRSCSCFDGQAQFESSTACVGVDEGCYRLSDGVWCTAICPTGYENVDFCDEGESCLEVTAELICQEAS